MFLRTAICFFFKSPKKLKINFKAKQEVKLSD